MGTRRAMLLLAGTAIAILTLAGCSDGGQETADGATSEPPPQDGLQVGTKAPDFRLKNQDQETIALSDYRGVKNVVLVFYPADFTPV